ncbi:hypothetical protein TVAG_248090, partial [Trichomonas vaginalis G3]
MFSTQKTNNFPNKNFISKQTKFDIDEEVKKEIISEDRSQNNLDQKPQIFTRLRKIPNHPIENWIKSQEITNLIQKSPNQTIYINSSPGSYIVLDNSQGRCIINVASQKYAINNNDFKDLSGIIDNRYKITSAAIIDGCLTFILLNNYEVSVIVYRNSEIPTDPGMGEIIDLDVKTAFSGTCIHIINNELHIYTASNSITIFDLRNMIIVDEKPQYYIYSTVNFSEKEIFGISFHEDTILVDIRPKGKCEDYLTIIRPCFTTESQIAVSLIIDDILMEITNSLISLIKTGKAQCDYADNPTQHVEFILGIIKELNNSSIDKNLMNFLNLMLDRLLILNLRQIYSSNKMINDKDKSQIVAFFGKQLPTAPIQETYGMMIRAVKYGIYWPNFGTRIENDYFAFYQPELLLNDIYKLPQSVFFPWSNIKARNSKVFAEFIIEKIYDLYTIVKHMSDTTKQYFDQEFISFIDFVFNMYDKQNKEFYEPVLKALLSVLSVIPMRPYLVKCVITNLDKLFKTDIIWKYFIKQDSNFTELILKYLINYGESTERQQIEKPTSISLNTTIFAPENVCGDIETYFATPFRKIKVTQKDFVKGQVNQNAFFNYEELLSESAEINGQNVSIDIIGNNKSTQYILEGIVSKICSQDFSKADPTYALFPYLFIKCAQNSTKSIPLTEMEQAHADILSLPHCDKPNEEYSNFRTNLRDVYSAAERDYQNPKSIFHIIAKATTQKMFRKRTFNID